MGGHEHDCGQERVESLVDVGRWVSFRSERWQGHPHYVAYSGVLPFAQSVRFETAVLAVARHEFGAGVEHGRADFEDGVAWMSVVCSRGRNRCGRKQIDRWLNRVEPEGGWPPADIGPLGLTDALFEGCDHQVGEPMLPPGDVCAERVLTLVSGWDTEHDQLGRYVAMSAVAPPDEEMMSKWLICVCAQSQECAMRHLKGLTGTPTRRVTNINEMLDAGSASSGLFPFGFKERD